MWPHAQPWNRLPIHAPNNAELQEALHHPDRTNAFRNVVPLSHEAQAGTAVTCHLSPGLAWSHEMPAQSARRPKKRQLLAFCQGSD